MSSRGFSVTTIAARAAPLTLVLFAAVGLAGGWQGMPPLVLLGGFGLLPGFALVRACGVACRREGEPCMFAGPGNISAALSVSLVVLIPALLPLFALHLPIGAARWTLGVALLGVGLASLREAGVSRESSSAEWIAAAAATALLLPAVLTFAGGTVDDWWDLGFVRSYSESAALSFAEPVLGTGRVHPRFAWNGWLLLQSLVASFSGSDPIDLQGSAFAGFTCIVIVSAAALLGRALLRTRTAVCATLLFLPFWLWGTEAIPFFTRLHQDKFVTGFALVPVMLASTLAALERRRVRFVVLAALSFVAASSVHGLVFAVGALGVAICCVVAAVRAVLGFTSADVRATARYAATVLLAVGGAALYPAWQAWTVRAWFSAQGISLALDDNPVVRAHLNLERLLAPGSWASVVHPGAVFGPIAIFALIGAAGAWRSRRERAAAYLLALTMVPGALVFFPGLAAIAGTVFVPWMLYRVGWLIPVPQLGGWLFEGLSHRSDAAGRAIAAAMVALAALIAVSTAADRLRRDMLEHPPRREQSPRGNDWHLFKRMHAWPESGAVLAPAGIATLVPGITGRPTVATSERGTVVFAGDEVDAYRRLRARADFFAHETGASERERIARRYGVRLVVFRKRLAVDGSERDWLWRSGPEGFLLASGADRTAQWTRDAIVGAVPSAWTIVYENDDVALVRTPFSAAEHDSDDRSPRERSWEDVFDPHRSEPALASPVLASLASWPGGRLRMQPIPASLGASERPVWLGGGEIWDDAPEAVVMTFDLGAKCLVDGIELTPFLRTRRREVLEIRTADVSRRLRAADGVPLDVRVPPARVSEVRIAVRSMTGEAFALIDVRVHGDPKSCERPLEPASRARIEGAEPGVSELVQVARDYPNDARARIGLARRIAASGGRADARALLESALLRDPAAGPVWIELGLLRDADGDFDGARYAYDRAVRADSNSAWAHGCVAWAELRRSRELVALYHGWRAARLDPRYSDAYTIMGAAARALRMHGLARNLFRRAIHLDRLRGWPYLELARMLSEAGDTDAAVRVLEARLKLVPDDGQARGMLGQLRSGEEVPLPTAGTAG